MKAARVMIPVFAHFCYAADILYTVFGREAQVVVDAATDVVSVQDAAQKSPLLQFTFQGDSDGAFPRTAQSGEPYHDAMLMEERFLVGTS